MSLVLKSKHALAADFGILGHESQLSVRALHKPCGLAANALPVFIRRARILQLPDRNRISHWAVLERDRDATDRFLLLVEFDSYEQGMENSSRPEVGEFAAFIAGISNSAPTFRSLDVLREEDL